MKVAVIGAGITGLTSAYKLTQEKHEVTVFEKEKAAGGLVASFQMPAWEYPLEKHYHHWFANDTYILSLISQLGLTKYLFFPKSTTGIFFEGKQYSFDSPFDVLSFSPLSFTNRLHTGFLLLYLKLLFSSSALKLEKYTAYSWLRQHFGKKVFKILWQPLLYGKFGPFAEKVNMTWFWARIKKRTLRLGYLEGGYQKLVNHLVEEIRKKRGELLLNTPWRVNFEKDYDRIIFTAPSSEFIRSFPRLPQSYKEKLSDIPHLHALTLIIIAKTKLLKNIYWLNINEPNFPFVGVIQHTNMIDSKYYAGEEIAYIANYLPDGHPYLTMKKEELFRVYLPYLKKINPSFRLQPKTDNLQLFSGMDAQPVFFTNYSKVKPEIITPIPNVYLANMDMVYPWDRGTNYAVELGYKVANIVLQSISI